MEATLQVPTVFWTGFFVLVTVLLALDLGVFNRKSHVVTVGEAARWTAVWVSLGLLFNGAVWYFFGGEAALTFLTGYLVEYSLSVDNIFVFVLLFSSSSVPPEYQHRVLFWGILGAVLMRGALIFAGVALLERFGWIMYVFGAFLLFAGVRMFAGGNDDAERDMKDSAVFRFLSRILPVSDEYDGQR